MLLHLSDGVSVGVHLDDVFLLPRFNHSIPRFTIKAVALALIVFFFAALS